ncbi:TPA: hypothetical protein DIS56_02000 [Candidatus Saccharibacteria bacterium]|nr:MAG: Glucose-6-phosphate 1-dehydrogenase [Candidatus Saccharibacteria bacterium GW2011_GWA2_46_10]OGL35129.1 MAG: hypothetical protein A3F05_03535 [Candidatus Saccharibacteria bacterium RIFCSPHIGHO2_12_FULL_47_17]HCM51883.1 hypothetical protein [Candidatus Saccharibacteria bacterium]
MGELPPTILVIFGITGDLSHRKLLPALAEIKKAGQLPVKFKLLGISRRAITKSQVLTKDCADLANLLEVHTMDVSQPAEYQKLKQKLDSYGHGWQIIFYFAVPPKAVLPIVRHLSQAGLNLPHTKLLLEKPFGVDYHSAKELISEMEAHFKEQQVFRIDHYLAKEMAQNITVFLGSNTIFRDLWSNEFIESIEITALEKIGIEGRIELWESTGTLRDFVQSHLLQMTALILMKPCSDIFDFDEIPRRRLAALEAIKPAIPSKAVRAQYQGYRTEVGNPGSFVESFVHLTVESNDPRWRGVPIYLMTGKKLDEKFTSIRVRFKQTDASATNLLIFRIQPNEGIEIDLWVKKPGLKRELQKLKLDFSYDQSSRLPDAYEMVIVDAVRSNHSLFASSAEVLASWKILQPLLESWLKGGEGLKFYKPGSTYEEVLKA